MQASPSDPALAHTSRSSARTTRTHPVHRDALPSPAVEAIQRGASDYLAKPFTPDELYAAANRAIRGAVPVSVSSTLIDVRPCPGSEAGLSPE